MNLHSFNFNQFCLSAIMCHLGVYRLSGRFWRKLAGLVERVAAWQGKPADEVDQYDLLEWAEFVRLQNLARRAVRTGSLEDLHRYLQARRR